MKHFDDAPVGERRWHFPWLSETAERQLFAVAPSGVAADSSVRTLGLGLGATLYVPAGRAKLVATLRQAASAGAVAAVICLEDSIGAADLEAAEANLSAELSDLPESTRAGLPMLFVRPRSPEHLVQVATRHRRAVDRFVGACLPKFTATNAGAWFAGLRSVEEIVGRPFLAMPILEGPEVLYLESRTDELVRVAAVLDQHRDRVVAVRIGGTDLCALLGLRRSIDETAYDIGPLRSCIADIVNVMGRAEGGFVISGPVCEYFEREPRLWKPQLRESLFVEGRVTSGRSGLRSSLIKQHLDGLIKEAVIDRANGLAGKTVIHPSHVLPVNSLAVPTYEEWTDATAISQSKAGVSASAFGNKMNETRPHASWAARVLERSQIFGVLAMGASFVDLLDA
jgi:citrate lyase beta subunit